jgi:predicted AAA+ superfamily ATPase
MYGKGPSSFDLARLADPMLALQESKGLVVLDEVQRRPELFPVLRVLADRKPVRTSFLVNLTVL